MPAEKRKVSSKKLQDAKGKKKRDFNEETGSSDVDAHQKIQDEK